MPLPFPKKEPMYIKINIAVEEIILKCIPIIDPKIKKNKMNSVFPRPIPK